MQSYIQGGSNLLTTIWPHARLVCADQISLGKHMFCDNFNLSYKPFEVIKRPIRVKYQFSNYGCLRPIGWCQKIVRSNNIFRFPSKILAFLQKSRHFREGQFFNIKIYNIFHFFVEIHLCILQGKNCKIIWQFVDNSA